MISQLQQKQCNDGNNQYRAETQHSNMISQLQQKQCNVGNNKYRAETQHSNTIMLITASRGLVSPKSVCPKFNPSIIQSNEHLTKTSSQSTVDTKE